MDGGCLERRLSKDRGIFWSITRTGLGKSCLLLDVARLHANIQLVVNSMTLIAAMKKKISRPVESLYGFDTSRAPESISKNAELAQALLTDMTFIYRVRPIAIVIGSILSPVHVQEFKIGGTRQHAYRHPIIQKAINLMWFQSKDGDGIVFYELFMPIPIQAIALALTVVSMEAVL
jgi:hypothetical protein